ncbi:permease [bacterium]|nr:permease [bacterium]
MIYFIYILAAVATLISLLINSQKTKKALTIGAKKLWHITPPFVSILVVISIVLYLVPHGMIVKHLGDADSYLGVIVASIIGSATVMPGPIVYPLCEILVDNGVSYSVVAAFSSSLMLVGVITFPVEKAYFGTKVALFRNLISFLIALIIAFVFSLVSGRLI